MKNNLWIILVSVVVTLSSCITAAQFNNADDDVYYSPKTSTRKEPVMIPEVDVDEIIRQHPPQYGNPTNRLDDEVYTNPMAAVYYPAYKSYQDTLNFQNARVSAYVDPSQATQSESQEAEYLRQMYSGKQSNWNVGVGLSWWGPTFSVGYSSNPYYNNYYDPYYGYGGYGYNSYGYNGYGYGYNSYYNPYYYGWGYGGWYTPWYGYGCGGYYPWYGYGCNDNHGNSSNSGNQPISHPRPGVGSNTPPVNAGRGNVSPDNTPANSSAIGTNGRYAAPALPGRTTQPMEGTAQPTGRSNNFNYTPSTPQQNLQNVNGRQVYTRPVPVDRPAPENSGVSLPASGRASGSGRNSGSERPMSGTTQPNYNSGNQHYSMPSNGGGRSSVGGSGGGRSSSGGGGSSSGGGGGRRR
jgi:hypothetical protein